MNKTDHGWPGVYDDAVSGDRSWRNYHPRELLIQWSKYENADDETQTLATLASPLFGCHVDEYTSKVDDPRFKEVGFALSEY